MTSPPLHIDVAVALPVYNTFTYSVPDDFIPQAAVGKRVLAPFGRRRVTGYILEHRQDRREGDIKAILDILDETPLFPASMVPFFNWIANYYLHPIGDVIKSALPGGLNLYDFITIAITEKGEQALDGDHLTPLENAILNSLKHCPIRFKDLRRTFKQSIPNSLVYAMERRGLIICERKLTSRTDKPKMERHVSLLNADIPTEKLSAPRKKILAALKTEGELSVKRLKARVPSAPRLINAMAKTGLISISDKRVYRDPFGESIMPDTAHILTGEQHHATAQILRLLGGGFTTCLLTGVTGSGKTEVYLQITAEAVKRDMCVLVLVPEIALISQMQRRFRARFGESVAILHSGLSAGERYDQWIRIARREVNIAIGARSAIFAPFANIGVIIVDEEHDTSYKQDSGLRYNARDLAVVRAKLNDGVALLGSATPSIQSYHNVTSKKFIEVKLTQRVEKRPLPQITVVDLRKAGPARGIRRFITPQLHESMEETLADGKQILLFLNRRGFASYPVCSDCGEALKCKNCDISLTLHQQARAYRCHYCGLTLTAATGCLKCGSNRISLLGLGTEKVEAGVKSLFPDAAVARMDRDTTTRKGSVIKILKGLRNQTIDILVGTQMVAKGHDFPNITLVGIICADLSLNFPDFRACERTFQLLAQVSGRAGRGEAPGHVILQTYNPDHFSILSATEQNFHKFYDQEIHFRKALTYPPFSRMIQLKISGKDGEKTRQYALAVGNLCRGLLKSDADFMQFVEVLGPIEASLPKIAKRHRWQIILKGLKVNALHRFIQGIMFDRRAAINRRDVHLVVDVDPFFMM